MYDVNALGLGIVNPGAKVQIVFRPGLVLDLQIDPRVSPADVVFVEMFKLLWALQGQVQDLQTVIAELHALPPASAFDTVVDVTPALERIHAAVALRAQQAAAMAAQQAPHEHDGPANGDAP